MAERRQKPQQIEIGLRVVAQILRIAEQEARFRVVPAIPRHQRQNELASQAESRRQSARSIFRNGSIEQDLRRSV